MFSPKPITDFIILRIRESKKIKDLKKLQVSGYLSADEYSIMKDIVKHEHGSIKYTGFEYFVRGSFPYLEISLIDFWKGKTESKDFFAEKNTDPPFSITGIVPKINYSKKIPYKRSVKYSKKTHTYPKQPVKEIEWAFKISDQFMSSIKKMDKKLQGRILEAITKITLSPTTSSGDTIKPLTVDLEGFWRYRIGNYRLIYKPVEKLREITLISFAARGSAYE